MSDLGPIPLSGTETFSFNWYRLYTSIFQPQNRKMFNRKTAKLEDVSPSREAVRKLPEGMLVLGSRQRTLAISFNFRTV